MHSIDIRNVAAPDVIAIRWPILRAGLPRESAVFPGDRDAATLHLGAFREGLLVGVATIYPAEFPAFPDEIGAWQLRGMATLPEVRGLGYGRALVEACVREAEERNGWLIWCNARTGAVDFYRKQGFEGIGEVFEIPTAGPHLRMYRRREAHF